MQSRQMQTTRMGLDAMPDLALNVPKTECASIFATKCYTNLVVYLAHFGFRLQVSVCVFGSIGGLINTVSGGI